ENCDYLVEGCRALAPTLLSACPHVKLLATSRRSLRVHAGTLYTLPPFSSPQPEFARTVGNDAAEMILAYDARRLFKERAEQTLLARLSVFAGGWDLEAAERVCSGGIVAERSVLDLLTGLIDKSWVIGETREAGGGTAARSGAGPRGAAAGRRYRFLETIR